jgi:glycine oxidase
VHNSDVVIAGAGIIGLSLAIELRRAGATVAVLDRGEPGNESSSAAAGMLVTADPDTNPISKPLANASATLYPAFVEELELRSGVSIGYESRGALYVATGQEQFPFPELPAAQVRELEPALAEYPGVWFLEEQSIDPRLLVRAALLTAKHLGITVHHEAQVLSVTLTEEHRLDVQTARGSYVTAIFVNCAGAWAGEISGVAIPTRPVKGQMLAVIPQKCGLRHVIRSPHVYLVPREGGKVVIGSTVEEAGFDKTVDSSTIQRLHQAAANLVPAIGEAKIVEAWAGLRPGSPDDLPMLGPGSLPGTYVATGHFRNGILLAPITAIAMAELIQGKQPRVDLRPFAPTRFRSREVLAG